MKKIIILIGPKGSGKTHIGKILDSRMDIHFLDVEPIWIKYYDECRTNGCEPTQEKAIERVNEAIEQTGKKNIAFETTAASGELRDFITKLSKTCIVKQIGVKAPLDVCLNRIKTRAPKNQIPTQDDKIQEVHDISSSLNLDYDLILKNNSLSDDEIIKCVKKAALFY